MSTIPERLATLEAKQVAQEAAHRSALLANTQVNDSMFKAIEVRINSMEQSVEAFAPVLQGMSNKLDDLFDEKKARDVLASQPKKNPWDKLLEKLGELGVTAIAGLVLWGVGWVILQGFLKFQGH